MTEVCSEVASWRMVGQDDIQLLRYWRNLDHVRNGMLRRDFISKARQLKWFEELDFRSARHFIFSLNSKDIGCVNISKIDVIEKTFESGIYCGDQNYLNHWINIWACIKLYDYSFFELGLSAAFARILKQNHSALILNKSLGYEYVEDFDERCAGYVLTRDNYVEASRKCRRYIRYFVKQSV